MIETEDFEEDHSCLSELLLVVNSLYTQTLTIITNIHYRPHQMLIVTNYTCYQPPQAGF